VYNQAMTSRAVMAKLKADGWELVQIRGSHQQFKHPTKSGRVTLPHPKKELPIGTLRSIYRQAGWDWEKR
jgi:predicted RNA binding protein YcfA (HicA-like mRNA interferase family)